MVSARTTTSVTRQTHPKVGSKRIIEVGRAISDRLRALTQYNTEAIRSVRRDFSSRLATEPSEFVVALALELVRGSHVPKFFAYELVQHHRQAMASLRARSLESFGRGNDSWEKLTRLPVTWRARHAANGRSQIR